jgi:hypothetical protein
MQDEGSSARLEWSQEKLHSSPPNGIPTPEIISKTHDKTTSRRAFGNSTETDFSTGDGHVSPVQAWIHPASNLHGPVITSSALNR